MSSSDDPTSMEKSAPKATDRSVPKAQEGSSRRVTFPNRVTLDLDDDRYQWLTDTADNNGAVGSANLLRAALDHLREHPGTLKAVVSRAQQLRRAQRESRRRWGK